MNDTTEHIPFTNSSPTKIIDGISIYERGDYNEWFELKYAKTAEPWDYSRRAAELFRHQYSVQKVRRYNAAPQTLLELGCSKGLMTKLLTPFTQTVYATDISITALKACKQNCDAEAKRTGCQLEYFLTNIPGLPFAANSFDVVTVCDGIAGWFLSEDQKRLALKDVYGVLKKGGIAILTDCLMPEQNNAEFEAYKALIHDSPLSVVEISFLYDKPWYKLESLLKKTGLERKLSRLLSSVSLAKTLNSLGHFFAGKKASRHIVIIVRKD